MTNGRSYGYLVASSGAHQTRGERIRITPKNRGSAWILARQQAVVGGHRKYAPIPSDADMAGSEVVTRATAPKTESVVAHIHSPRTGIDPTGPGNPRQFDRGERAGEHGDDALIHSFAHGIGTIPVNLELYIARVLNAVAPIRSPIDQPDHVPVYGQRLCVIMNNLNTHKNGAAQEWLTRYPGASFHYTPTQASWANLIEGFFSVRTRQGLQKAVHNSTKELAKFRKHYIREYNKRCGPFAWSEVPAKSRKNIRLTKRFQNGKSE